MAVITSIWEAWHVCKGGKQSCRSLLQRSHGAANCLDILRGCASPRPNSAIYMPTI